MGASKSQHRGVYKANLHAQELTEKTAMLYGKYLRKNRDRIKRSESEIEKEYRVAENTYDTVSTAYTLASMMKKSDSFYRALAPLQIPDLLKFKNKEMKMEFQKLTQKMSQIVSETN